MTKPSRTLDNLVGSLGTLNYGPSSNNISNEGRSCDGDKVEINNEAIEAEGDEDVLLESQSDKHYYAMPTQHNGGAPDSTIDTTPKKVPNPSLNDREVSDSTTTGASKKSPKYSLTETL